MRAKINFQLIIILSITILCALFVSAQNVSNTTTNYNISGTAMFVLENQSYIPELFYDRMNGTLGSDSFMDYSPTNENAFIYFCHDDIAVNQQIDISYYTESENITSSILNYKPQITNIIPGTNCTQLDMDLASRKFVYPGYVAAQLTSAGNMYALAYMNTIMNGSYNIELTVDGPTHTYYLSVGKVYDKNKQEITVSENQLLMSLKNALNQSVLEDKLSLREPTQYTGNFYGGEKVYVNGLKSLEIISIPPCTNINDSGYYILNESAWNKNESCMNIENQTGVIVNFGSELIDGDNLANGSMDNTTNPPCAVHIKDSQNITIEYLYVQQFYYGICIENSEVTILQDTAIANEHGAKVYDGSTALMIDVFFQNNNSDIRATNDSRVNLIRTNFSTAQVKMDFEDLIVKGVPNPPPGPPESGQVDIDQWIQLQATDNKQNGSWAQLNFYYDDDMPDKVVTNNMSIYEYNGTYSNGSIPTYTWNNITNITDVSYYNSSNYTWHSGNWTKIFTIISPSEQLIVAPTLYNFSVYAPYGEPTNYTEPEPEPDPDPTPDPDPQPQSGLGSGGGGNPANGVEDEAGVFAEPVELILEIPNNITLQQGEAREVPFNISNVGAVTAYDLMIEPTTPYGWDYTNISIGNLEVNEKENGTFEIAPYEKEKPGTYSIIVSGTVESEGGRVTAVSEILTVYVTPRSVLERIKILEFPPIVEMEPNIKTDISFLAENIGDVNIENISIQLYSKGNCLDENVEGLNNIEQFETKLITYTFKSKSNKEECKYNVKFYSGDTLIGFVPVKFKIESKSFLTSQKLWKKIILIVILILWSLLTGYVFTKKRKVEHE